MRSFILALAAALSLSSCAPMVAVLGALPSTSTAPTGVIQAAGDKVILQGTRGFLLAENAYQGAAAALTPFVAARRFTPAQVNMIEAANERAHGLLVGADKGLTLAQRTAGLLGVADTFNRLIGR